jgi:hypothetical protein
MFYSLVLGIPVKLSAVITIIISLFISSAVSIYAQEENDFEFYLIDNYVTPEQPHRFILSFFTSDNAKTKVMIDDKDEYIVSETLIDNHKIEIDISKLTFSNTIIPFFMTAEDSAGNKYYSERYEFELPYETEVKSGSGILTFCLFGGVVFGLPSPVYVRMNEENYFSLTKEIPLVFLKSTGLGYPTGYFSAEYSHIFNAPVKNFLRAGYKHLIEVPGIEYVSPGLNGFTNFNGFNGISPELSIGLFRIYNVFTVYSRYRFNVKPGTGGNEFHEVSLGLYSGFFAIYL